MDKLTIEEIKKETMKLLGTTDVNSVSYITEELLNQEAEEIVIETIAGGSNFRSYYGHNMSYGSRNGQPTYEFSSNPQWSGNVCAGTNRYWYYQSRVNHFSTGQRCTQHNNSSVIRFEPRQ